jgi:hypothetical protein
MGTALIVGLAFVTGSVLLIGYAAAAASLLAVVALLAKTAVRRESIAPTESFLLGRGEEEEREAA